jgi:putative transposase
VHGIGWCLPAKSFFSTLKIERVFRSRYKTRDEARADIFDYIERFYNPKCRHSTLNGLSPVEFEKRYASLTVCP